METLDDARDPSPGRGHGDQISLADLDSSEEELEKLIFGESDGFRASISNFQSQFASSDKSNEIIRQQDNIAAQDLEGLPDAELFFRDDGPVENANLLRASSSDQSSDEGEPAWYDSDDDRITVSLASVPRLRKLRVVEDEDQISGMEYSLRLRRQYERLHPTPAWVGEARARQRRGSSAERSDSDDEIGRQPSNELRQLLQGGKLVATPSQRSSKRMRPEVINVQMSRDFGDTQACAITSLSLHPTLPLLLSSADNSTIYIHHCAAPQPNRLLTSIHIRKAAISSASFCNASVPHKIFLGSRGRHFLAWNLETGAIEKMDRVFGHREEQLRMEHFKVSPDGEYIAFKGTSPKGSGVVNILSASTLQWISEARIESRGGVADFAWWSDGTGLCIAGKNGEVTEWNVEECRPIARWTDEGAHGTTVVSLGGKTSSNNSAGMDIGSDRWVAMGSASGIVNIYDRREWRSSGSIPERPQPKRTLDQLVTAISGLTFSADGQLLAVSSRWKKDALRLVHLPSCSVYRNWPTSGTPLGRVTDVGWGMTTEGDVLLVVGNEQGKIRSWEVRSA